MSNLADHLASVAYTRGRRDGLNGGSSALNPYPEGSAEAEEWRQGHSGAMQEVDNYANAKPRREWWESRADHDTHPQARAA